MQLTKPQPEIDCVESNQVPVLGPASASAMPTRAAVKRSVAKAKRYYSWTSSLWYFALGATILMLASSRTSGAEGLDVHFIEGFSKPNRISNLATATSGIIEEISIEEGSPVSKGQCVLKLRNHVHQQLLKIADLSKQAVGERDAAKAELKSATHRVEIIRQLSQHGSATPDELLRAETEYELALANVTAIEEKLLLREAEYEKLTIEAANYCVEAPFDGVIVEFMKEQGEFVGPSDPTVCLLAELNTLSVEFLVPREHRTGLELDSVVEVHFIESGIRVAGHVYYISPFPNGETNTYAVKVRVQNESRQLFAGERCQLERHDGGFRTVQIDDTKKPKLVSKVDSEANQTANQTQ